MPKQLDINHFLSQSTGKVVLDVRTPKEFQQGHIPKAINLPLFTNEERVMVGTIYKQEGRENAILKGLEIVGPKLATFITQTQSYTSDKTIFIHCWRGGMRSGSMAWLLELYGYTVFVLKGGYKQFRNHVLGNFKIESAVKILSGKTGSGKTHVLHEMQKLGAQVIDLESLAHHKGSAFGALGEEEQPSQEQFENELFFEIRKLKPNQLLWLEDESRMIGKKVIPLDIWDKMRQSQVVYIDVPFETRVLNLVNDYGNYSPLELEKSILKISRRLGPEQTKLTLEALHQNNLKMVCEMCLHYYDKSYSHGLEKREKPDIKTLAFDELNFNKTAQKLLNIYGKD
jgi:tRNA 2-selenouridine synthase